MKNCLILTPSIYFHKHQNQFMDNMLKNHEQVVKNDEGQFFHFTVSDKDYTFIITTDVLIYFVRGCWTANDFPVENIIFKNHFNLIEGAKHNYKVLDDSALEYESLFAPSFNAVRSQYDMRSYSGYYKDDFKVFSLLLNDESENNFFGNILFELYEKEYVVVRQTIHYKLKDLYETLSLEKFKCPDEIEEMEESGLIFRVKNFLIESRDSWLTVLEFLDEEIVFYSIDKDKYFSNITDEEYEDPENIFFYMDDFINKMEKVKTKILPHKNGMLSNDLMSFDPTSLFFFMASLESSNGYLFEEYKITNQLKKLIPSDLDSVFYSLLSSTSLSWYQGSLYDPNKVLGIDTSVLSEFMPEPSFKYSIVCSNPLMNSYSEGINSEWLKAIDETLIFAKTLCEALDSDGSSDSIKEMGAESLSAMLHYRENIN